MAFVDSDFDCIPESFKIVLAEDRNGLGATLSSIESIHIYHLFEWSGGDAGGSSKEEGCNGKNRNFHFDCLGFKLENSRGN